MHGNTGVIVAGWRDGDIGVALTDATADSGGYTVDEAVGLVR
jgi:hypothetical protein